MGEVICNTSPIQYLYQLGLLDLLPALFSEVGPILARLDALGFRLDPQTRSTVLELAGETA